MDNIDFIVRSAREVVGYAVSFIREQAKNFDNSKVEYKGHNDLVSYVDKTSEEILVKGLFETLPGSGFITEENTASAAEERFRWIIDPLDGTTNFVHGVPCYAVSVALYDNDTCILGIVHEINLNECFHAVKGRGAFLNDQPVKISGRKTLEDALVVTGFPYTDYSRLENYMKVFDYCMHNTHGIRRPGSAAVDLAYVAAGRYEVFYEYGLNSWDVAAGALIVSEAGGTVTDFSGGANYVFGKEIVATNSLVHKEFMKVIREYMK